MTKPRYTERRQVLRAGAGLAVSVAVAGCAFLRDETGEKPDGAELRHISYGETKQGYIHESDGSDPEYGDVAEPVEFEGEAGDAVTITMEAPDTSAYLVLEAPNGFVVAEHQRGEGSTSIIETTLPETGTYTIWAGSTGGAETGPYSLTLEQTAGDVGGSGNRDLRSISYGETKEGYIETDDGTDPKYGDVAEPVEFEGQSGDTVTITMEAPGISAYLVLEAPDGSAIAEHQEGAGSTSIITKTLPASGTYTIWAGSTGGSETGAYTLTLERGSG